MHSTHAHRLPLGTSNNLDFGSYKLSKRFSLFFCMPPQGADVTNTIKMLPIHRYPYKTSKNGGFRVVPGGPRPRNCRVGHPHGRRIPRGAPFKNIDFGSYKLWLDFSRFLTHLVLWNSTGGHSAQDADLTISTKT